MWHNGAGTAGYFAKRVNYERIACLRLDNARDLAVLSANGRSGGWALVHPQPHHRSPIGYVLTYRLRKQGAELSKSSIVHVGDIHESRILDGIPEIEYRWHVSFEGSQCV